MSLRQIADGPPGTPRVSVVDSAPLQSTRVISNDFFTDHHFPSQQYTLAFMVMSQLFTHDVLSLKLRNPRECERHNIALFEEISMYELNDFQH